MIIEPLLGPSGRIPILIRDDDTNFFTKVDMLRTIHSKAWDRGFKVSLSVVPFQKGTDDVSVPPEVRQTGLLYPIVNNEELIKFLKDKVQRQYIEILQHGFSHSIVDGYRGEFGVNISKQRDNLQSGRESLKNVLGFSPEFFVPPYDDISHRNLKLIRQQHMLPVYGQENIHKFFRSPYIPRFFKRRAAKQIFNKLGKSAFIVPVNINPNEKGMIVSLPHIKEEQEELNFERLVSLDTFFDSVSKIISFAKYNRNNNSSNRSSAIRSLCIVNHYHQYFYDWSSSITRTEMFRIWQKLLDYLGDLTFGWKTTFSELYNRAKKVRKINISKTGAKITVESTVKEDDIEYLSFQINSHVERSNENIVFDRDTKIVTIKRILPKSKIVLYVTG